MNDLILKFLDYLEYEKHFSKLTVLNYQKDLEKFESFLKSENINTFSVDVNTIRKYLTHLHNKLSKRSICRHISSLRTFFKYVCQKKYIKNKNHLVIESVHPSPLSVYNGFFGSKPFSKANNFLKQNKIKEVDFRLPNC